MDTEMDAQAKIEAAKKILNEGPSLAEMVRMGRRVRANIRHVGDYNHFKTALGCQIDSWMVWTLRELFND